MPDEFKCWMIGEVVNVSWQYEMGWWFRRILTVLILFPLSSLRDVDVLIRSTCRKVGCVYVWERLALHMELISVQVDSVSCWICCVYYVCMGCQSCISSVVYRYWTLFSPLGKLADRAIYFTSVIYWTDFHNFFTKWKVFAWMLSVWISVSDFSREVAIAINFAQNWQTDLHSAPWHFKMDWNITIWISSFIAPIIRLHRIQIVWTLVQ